MSRNLDPVPNTKENEDIAFINLQRVYTLEKLRSDIWFYPCIYCQTDTFRICYIHSEEKLFYVCLQCQKRAT